MDDPEVVHYDENNQPSTYEWIDRSDVPELIDRSATANLDGATVIDIVGYRCGLFETVATFRTTWSDYYKINVFQPRLVEDPSARYDVRWPVYVPVTSQH